jgi:hypothetical protein
MRMNFPYVVATDFLSGRKSRGTGTISGAGPSFERLGNAKAWPAVVNSTFVSAFELPTRATSRVGEKTIPFSPL